LATKISYSEQKSMALSPPKLPLVGWLYYVTELLRVNLTYLDKQFLLVSKSLDPIEVRWNREIEKAFSQFLDAFADYAGNIRRKWAGFTRALTPFQKDLHDYQLKQASAEIGWSKTVVSIYVGLLNKEMLILHPLMKVFPSALCYGIYPAGFTLEEPNCPKPYFDDESLNNIEIYERLLPQIYYFYLDDFGFLLDLARITGDYLLASYWACRLLTSADLRREKANVLARQIFEQKLPLNEIFPRPIVAEQLTIVEIGYIQKHVIIAGSNVFDIGRYIYTGFALLLLEDGAPLFNLTYESLRPRFPFQRDLEAHCANHKTIYIS
jgi:hypothetical protein